MDARQSLAQLERVFASLTPASVGDIPAVYSVDAWFKDPFNEVRGRAAIERIFVHMFDQLTEPRFVILGRVIEGNEAWLTWNLEYRLKPGKPVRRIHGASHLKFDADARVAYHRDYWDAAEELYESVPLLGGLLRMIKRRLRAH